MTTEGTPNPERNITEDDVVTALKRSVSENDEDIGREVFVAWDTQERAKLPEGIESTVEILCRGARLFYRAGLMDEARRMIDIMIQVVSRNVSELDPSRRLLEKIESTSREIEGLYRQRNTHV
jgi:hypothetical protein